MKLIIYYISLLLLIVIITWFSFAEHGGAMTMPSMIGVCAALVIYTVIISLIGEGAIADEREMQHRYFSNRIGLITGTAVLAIGVIYQLFISHDLDYWLLIALIGMNATKIITLIYAHYKK